MKNPILILPLFSFSGIINSDPVYSMMISENFKNISRVAVKRALPSMTERRTVHMQLKTKGFRPEKPIEITQWHTLDLPKRVEYLDETYEVFRTPPGFQEMIENSIKKSREKLDDPVEEKKK